MLKQQITQQELRKTLALSAGISEAAVVKVLEELTRVAASEAKLNGGFLLPGIGMIETVERFERTGVNPQTGEKIRIPPTTTLKFSFASHFKKAVSEK